MKNLMLIAVASLSAYASATEWTAEERKCAEGVYCVEKMVCIDRVDRPYPRGMADDYYQHVVSIRSFKSVKNNGGTKVLVDSLQVNADPVGPDSITMEQAKAQAEWRYGNYGAPMYIRPGNKVRMNMGPTSNFSRGVNFKIVSSRNTPEGRIDKLVGKETTIGDVVGNLTSSFDCEALVVDAPTRIDDLTTR